jgi:S-adenosylmethionine decarboxylase
MEWFRQGRDLILGTHWIAEVVPIQSGFLMDAARVRRFLEVLPETLGLTVVSEATVQQAEDGSIRGVVLLAESHASAHTDPDGGMLFVDLFSCKPFDAVRARAVVDDLWPNSRVSEQLLERGRP